MGKKLSQLESCILPCVRVLAPKHNGTAELASLSNTVSSLFCALSCKPEVLANKVQIRQLSSNGLKLLENDLKSRTFSFNIVFGGSNIAEKAWGGWVNKQSPKSRSERPILAVVDGETVGYVVYLYNNVPVLAVMSYSKNFNSWADRIGLRKTMKPSTSDPSTHFVFWDKAFESGLVWVSPLINRS